MRFCTIHRTSFSQLCEECQTIIAGLNLLGNQQSSAPAIDRLLAQAQSRAFSAPEDHKVERKDKPLFSGCLMYFPDALLEISHHSKKGNDKHNPGQPLHWSREKSKDHADCIARHLIDIGKNWDDIDPETGSLHATALAWRALALLQTVLEKKRSDVK